MRNRFGVDVTNIDHAYSANIGETRGMTTRYGIVPVTVMTPEPGQDDNIVNVQDSRGMWHRVRYMDTTRADFVNADYPHEYEPMAEEYEPNPYDGTYSEM